MVKHEFKWDFGQHVRHRAIAEVSGFVDDMSIDSAGVEWVKIVFAKDGGSVGSEWLRSKDMEPFTPSIGFQPPQGQ